jgi:hypothetical protein
MPWIRSLSLVVCVLACACTRDNPAFDEGADELLEGSETTRPSEESTTDTSEVPECELEASKDLVIELPQLCPLNEMTGLYEGSFIVEEQAADGWLGRICPPNELYCTNPDMCEGNPLRKIEIGPFDVSGLAVQGECLTIKAARAEIDVDPSNCGFDAIAIWKNDQPIVIASNGEALVVEALEDLGNVSVVPVHVEDPPCECVEDCCDAAQLGDHQFIVAGQEVPVGVSELAALPFTFHGLAAVNPSGCAEGLEFRWAMTRSP